MDAQKFYRMLIFSVTLGAILGLCIMGAGAIFG